MRSNLSRTLWTLIVSMALLPSAFGQWINPPTAFPPATSPSPQDIGNSVAMSGAYAVVGAQSTDDPSCATVDDYTGAAYVYRHESNGSWTLLHELRPPYVGSCNNGSNFGRSVAINGNFIAVGAPSHGLGGSVFLYKLDIPMGTCTLQTTFVGTSPQQFDGFGTSISLSATWLIVGAPMDSGIIWGTGKAFGFRNTGNWTSYSTVSINPGGLQMGDQFGTSVSHHGTRLAVGSPGRGSSVDEGAVYIFRENTTPASWSNPQLITPPAGSAFDEHFGSCVSVSNGRVLAGSPLYSTATDFFIGRALLYRELGCATPNFQLEDAFVGPVTGQFFGGSLFLKLNKAVVGTYKYNYQAVHTYTQGACGSPWTQEPVLTAPTTTTYLFGAALCTDGQTLIVGARGASNNQGEVYSFQRDWGACTHDVEFVASTDGAGGDISWEIRSAATGAVVGQGSGYTDNGSCQYTSVCLPDGDYTFQVYDAGGNGFTGSYLLRDRVAGRIVDNLDGFAGTGALHAGSGAFSLPIGTTRLIEDRCDFLTMRITAPGIWNFIVANSTAPFTACGIADCATAGYRYWIFDPDGGYNATFFKSTVSNGGAETFYLNAVTPALTVGKVYNIRVRPEFPGSNEPYGAACYFAITDEPTTGFTCRPSRLTDQPGLSGQPGATGLHSCDVTVNFDGLNPANAGVITATQVQGFVHYRFLWDNTVPGSLASFNVTRLASNPDCSRFMAMTNVSTSAPGCGSLPNWPTGMSPTAGSEWMVRVQVKKSTSSVWCDVGECCRVTIGTSTGFTGGGGDHLATAKPTTGLLVWPNPNDGREILVDASWVVDHRLPVNVELIDLFGRSVRSWVRQAGTEDQVYHVLPDGAIAPGAYFVKLTSGTEVRTARLVIE